MLFNWQEVYSSTDLTEVMRREDALRSHGIRFKTKVENLSMRTGTNGLAGRGGPVPETQHIYVQKDKAETAQYHLRALNRPE